MRKTKTDVGAALVAAVRERNEARELLASETQALRQVREMLVDQGRLASDFHAALREREEARAIAKAAQQRVVEVESATKVVVESLGERIKDLEDQLKTRDEVIANRGQAIADRLLVIVRDLRPAQKVPS